jgi:hypothetical protein
MSHLHNLTLWQAIRGIFIFAMVLAILYMVTSNLGLVGAGGVAVVAAHLIVASGLLVWGVRFIIRMHQSN